MKIKTTDSLKVFPWFVLYVAVAYFVNLLTGGNYFYLKHKPIFAGLEDVFYIPLSLLFSYVLFLAGEWMSGCTKKCSRCCSHRNCKRTS
ncbi:hypothetical protein [Salinicoccus sp. YB14-2]|uniref:TMEM164 family acyltransferase n=1 Tax=Salinicoccus sp. YB14-2 TaxID=1572701 RepID=UPI00351204E0